MGNFMGKLDDKMPVMPNLLQILKPIWFSVVSFCLLYKYWQSNLRRKFQNIYHYDYLSTSIYM